MRAKKRNIMCLIVVILSLFSSICFDQVKIDTGFMHPVMTSSDSVLKPVTSEIKEIRLCSTKVLSECRTSQSILLKGRNNSHKGNGHFPEFLYSAFFLTYVGKFCCDSENSSLSAMISPSHIINYIHRSDGKKRI